MIRPRIAGGGWTGCMAAVWILATAGIPAMAQDTREAPATTQKITVGAHYFDGWAGRNSLADDPGQPWAKNAPTHLNQRMVEEFSEREPIWGWRDDSLAIMEHQIDLAADSGLTFFSFCWYWHDNGKAINRKAIADDPKHTGLDLYIKAKNHHRLKFCLMVANHAGAEIKGTENWKQAAEFWMPYFKDPQYVTVNGKPLVIIFSAGDKDGFAGMQEVARDAGLPGLAIATCGHGTVETGFTYRTNYGVLATKKGQHNYEELAATYQSVWNNNSPGQPYIPVITAGWDKRPWTKPTDDPGVYYTNRTPEQFASYLRDAAGWMDKHPDQTTAERLVLVYAWNELGEGGYLVPTKSDPDAKYLKALRSVVMPATQPGQPATQAANDGKGERILFVGNSITLHGPVKNSGWTGNNWGMAASAEEKDYVHLVVDAVSKLRGGKPEFRVVNISDFERSYEGFDIAAKLHEYTAFKADTVIVAIGENVPALKTEEGTGKFKESVGQLLKLLKGEGRSDLYVRSCFWPNATKDAVLKEACTAAGGVFVDISLLSKDEENYARSERQFASQGVAMHPGDKGMRAIADAISAAIETTWKQSRQH